MLRVHSIETFGTQDGPGIRMVVFLQGCQFRCLYCHNPDTQEVIDSEGRPLGREFSVEDILEKLRGQRAFFQGRKGGGLTISGGEPLLQAKALLKLVKRARSEGFEVAIDTNGSIHNEDALKVLLETDLVLLDVKQINDKLHRELTERSNKQTLEMAKWLEKNKKRMWLRYVLVPGWSDDEKDLEKWARHFSDYQMIERVEILPFHQMAKTKYEQLGRDYKLKDTPTPDKETKRKAREIFEKYLGAKRVVIK